MLTPLLILALVGLCLGGVVPLHNEVDFTIDDPEFLKKLELLNNSLRMDIPEDAKLDVPELLQKYGYPVETHYVTTEDGYILALHRIPYGKKSPENGEKRKPFYLQHGILSSSADWIVTGPGKGFGYLLADAGYDVWMGNYRGNKYSRNHTTLNPDRNAKKFWNFSWHEMGIHDLPAAIDYILGVTGESKVLYAGHSQGTTGFFVMASERPEYNDKIVAQFSLAPIVYMNHMTSPLMKFMAIANGGLAAIFKIFGINEFLPNSDFLAKFGSQFCDEGITQALCTNAIFVICGFSQNQMNASLLPVLMGHTPAGASTKQFLHYSQEINSGHFRQYDYGLVGNFNKYHHLYPTEYKLSKVTAPIYLIYSHNDWLSAETDVNKLYKELGDAAVGKFIVADRSFNHLDYMFGIDAPELVYSKVISWASRYK